MNADVKQKRSWVQAHPFAVTVGAACLAFVAVVLIVEAAFYIPNQRKQDKVELEGGFPDEFITKDSIYGFETIPNRSVRSKKTLNHQFEYDVNYSSDEYGRRRTPVDPGPPRSHFMLFFVDSFAFGLGVNDNETLPYYAGRFAGDYMPYNYGCMGYGAQQMLLRFQTDTLRKQVPEKSGIAVYIFISRHVQRVVGTSSTVAWTKNYPCYEIVDGQLQYLGSFPQAHPVRSLLFSLLKHSQTLGYFNIDIPPRITDSHIELTARVIAESARLLNEQFAGSELYFLAYPGSTDPVSVSLMASLNAKGVKILYYQNLLDGISWPTQIPDQHPTPRAYEYVAERLTRDLGIKTNP